MDKETFKDFPQWNLQEVPLEQLTDIRDIHIEKNASKSERIASYLKQVSHPYLLRCGEVAIEISFSPDGPPLQELLQEYLARQKFQD